MGGMNLMECSSVGMKPRGGGLGGVGGMNLMECSSVGMKPRGGGLGVWEG